MRRVIPATEFTLRRGVRMAADQAGASRADARSAEQAALQLVRAGQRSPACALTEARYQLRECARHRTGHPHPAA